MTRGAVSHSAERGSRGAFSLYSFASSASVSPPIARPVDERINTPLSSCRCWTCSFSLPPLSGTSSVSIRPSSGQEPSSSSSNPSVQYTFLPDQHKTTRWRCAHNSRTLTSELVLLSNFKLLLSISKHILTVLRTQSRRLLPPDKFVRPGRRRRLGELLQVCTSQLDRPTKGEKGK